MKKLIFTLIVIIYMVQYGLAIKPIGNVENKKEIGIEKSYKNEEVKQRESKIFLNTMFHLESRQLR